MTRGPTTIYEVKGDLCNIQNDLAKTVLSSLGLTKKCFFEEDTVLCLKDDVSFTLSKASVRLLGVFVLDQSPLRTKTVLNHDTGRSCFDTQYKLVKT